MGSHSSVLPNWFAINDSCWAPLRNTNLFSMHSLIRTLRYTKTLLTTICRSALCLKSSLLVYSYLYREDFEKQLTPSSLQATAFYNITAIATAARLWKAAGMTATAIIASDLSVAHWTTGLPSAVIWWREQPSIDALQMKSVTAGRKLAEAILTNIVLTANPTGHTARELILSVVVDLSMRILHTIMLAYYHFRVNCSFTVTSCITRLCLGAPCSPSKLCHSNTHATVKFSSICISISSLVMHIL